MICERGRAPRRSSGWLGRSASTRPASWPTLDTKMINGPVEGFNHKLRVVARRAYGFHSHGALISMLFLCCGGIELAPPLPTRVGGDSSRPP